MLKRVAPNGLLCASSNQAAIRSQALFFRRQEFAASGQGSPRAGQGGPGSLSEPWFFPGHRVGYTVRRNLLVECCGAENVRATLWSTKSVSRRGADAPRRPDPRNDRPCLCCGRSEERRVGKECSTEGEAE